MDISGDVRLHVVFVEEGLASGNSICMRNVGAKIIFIYQNKHGPRRKCTYMTAKIAKKMSCILQITA